MSVSFCVILFYGIYQSVSLFCGIFVLIGIAIPSITPGTSALRTQKILSLYNILQSDLFVIPTLFNTANSRLLILIFVVSVLITLVNPMRTSKDIP